MSCRSSNPPRDGAGVPPPAPFTPEDRTLIATVRSYLRWRDTIDDPNGTKAWVDAAITAIHAERSSTDDLGSTYALATVERQTWTLDDPTPGSSKKRATAQKDWSDTDGG